MFGIIIIRKKTLRNHIRELLDKHGLLCYKVGKRMGETERSNQGILIGSVVNQQINEILERRELK